MSTREVVTLELPERPERTFLTAYESEGELFIGAITLADFRRNQVRERNWLFIIGGLIGMAVAVVLFARDILELWR